MITIILGIGTVGKRWKGVGGKPKEISWEHGGALQLWAAVSVSPADVSAWLALKTDTLPAASTTHIHPWVGLLLCKGGSWDLLSWANQAKQDFPQGFASSLGQNQLMLEASAFSWKKFPKESAVEADSIGMGCKPGMENQCLRKNEHKLCTL